jgi:hypothetical protein
MDNRNSKAVADRVIGACCFIGAVVFALLGIWLCILGEFPAIKTGDNGYMIFGVMNINGADVPGWAFYFIPAGLFIIAFALWFIGRHKSLGRRDENT